MCDNLCPECGMPPGECYRICPTQDPYGGDQMAEHYDHEFNARYDDVRERFAATAEDADMFFSDADHEACSIPVEQWTEDLRDTGMWTPVTGYTPPADDDDIPF